MGKSGREKGSNTDERKLKTGGGIQGRFFIGEKRKASNHAGTAKKVGRNGMVSERRRGWSENSLTAS